LHGAIGDGGLQQPRSDDAAGAGDIFNDDRGAEPLAVDRLQQA